MKSPRDTRRGFLKDAALAFTGSGLALLGLASCEEVGPRGTAPAPQPCAPPAADAAQAAVPPPVQTIRAVRLGTYATPAFVFRSIGARRP